MSAIGKAFRKHPVIIGIGLALTIYLMGAAAKFYEVPLAEKLDAITYDYRMRLAMPGKLDKRIVIVDIDEKSLKEEGRWPWGRDRMAMVVNQLFEHYKAAVVGFDILFAETDQSSGLNILQALGHNQLKDVPEFQSALKKLAPQLEYDQLFASSLKGRKVVLAYYFSNNEQKSSNIISGALPVPVFPPGAFGAQATNFLHWDGYDGNLPDLQKAAASSGFINPLVDADGVVRRLPMVMEYGNAYYESLPLAMVRTLLGDTRLLPGWGGEQNDNANLEWLEIQSPQEKLRIPVDYEASSLVPYRGPRGSFPYISITDVLHGKVPPEQLANKIVLIGTSTPGLLDMRTTPVASVYPGVEIHANMIAGILDQNIRGRPPYVLAAEVLQLLVIGTLLSLLLPVLNSIWATMVSLGVLAAVVALNFWLWQSANLDFPIANSLILILGLFLLDMPYGYFTETRTKRKLTGLFGQYVPAELVDEMSRNPRQVSMEGESREMTILFSDVRNFTSISEGLEPKELSLLMNEFLTPLTRVIYKHRGTVDKYMGDCIMAFWGAPLEEANHARNAILAGMEMQQALNALQTKFRERGWPSIQIGVGINTGKVSVGNMGSEIRVAYTVMGDAVNLASRLEGITKQYGADIIVGASTRNAVPGLIYRELDRVRVKGKDEPVTIFEPLGEEGKVGAALVDEVDAFHEFLSMYRLQAWDIAERQLNDLRQKAPQLRLYQLYAERIAYFRNHPPASDWDGVFGWETK